MLNKSGKCGYPYIVTDLRGNSFYFSPLSVMLAMGLFYMVFIILRYIPSILTLLTVFYHKQILKFIKLFFYICWDGHVFAIWQYSISNWFMIIGSFYVTGMNLTWKWCLILLNVVWFDLLIFCRGFLHMCLLVLLAYDFFCGLFFWFGIQCAVGLVEWV